MRKQQIRVTDNTTNALFRLIEEMKQNSIAEINDICTEKSNTLADVLHVLESKRNFVQTILSQAEWIRKYASNFQTFIGIKEIENIIERVIKGTKVILVIKRMYSRDNDRTWKTDIHYKEHTVTKIYTFKVTKVNEQLGLH